MSPRVFRLLILLLIDEYRPHGYELMKRINELAGNITRIGPGTIYPALFFLKARGLIREIKEGRRKRYELTEKGRAELEKYLGDLENMCREILRLLEERTRGSG